MTVIYEDILDSNADIVVIPVNAEGVHGAGLAKQFAIRFPLVAAKYRWDCSDPHSTMSTRGYGIYPLEDGRHILAFVTKKKWRQGSTPTQLKQVFRALREFELDLFAGKTVATPPLGAGLGRLNKEEVIPYIKRSFITLGAYVNIYDLPINKPKGIS